MVRCQLSWGWRRFFFQLECKKEKQCLLRRQSSMRSRLIRPNLPKISSRDLVQVSVKFSCNDGGDQSWWCLQWWCQRWTDANNDDEHKWKWLMMRTTRTRLTIWSSNGFPISSCHISKEWDGKVLLHEMIKVQYVFLHRCKSRSSDLRMVSPRPVPGDYDDYDDGGHKYDDVWWRWWERQEEMFDWFLFVFKLL